MVQYIVFLVAVLSHNDDDKNNKIKRNEDDEIRSLATDKQVIHQKVQLWTNKEENEYAIRLILDGDSSFVREAEKGEREFIASTDPKEEYTHPVAETDRFEDLKHGWEYALREFVDNYKKERLEKVKLSPPSHGGSPSSSDSIIGDLAADDKHDYYPIKMIPSPDKCTYCGIQFHNEEERKEHELAWHV
jgi:hypothetical protein